MNDKILFIAMLTKNATKLELIISVFEQLSMLKFNFHKNEIYSF